MGHWRTQAVKATCKRSQQTRQVQLCQASCITQAQRWTGASNWHWALCCQCGVGPHQAEAAGARAGRQRWPPLLPVLAGGRVHGRPHAAARHQLVHLPMQQCALSGPHLQPACAQLLEKQIAQ